MVSGSFSIGGDRVINILCDCCERQLKRDELQRLEIGENKVDFCGACTKAARAAVDALIAAAQAKRAEEREAARETLRAHRRGTEAAADRARKAEADAAAARAELETLQQAIAAGAFAVPQPEPNPVPCDLFSDVPLHSGLADEPAPARVQCGDPDCTGHPGVLPLDEAPPAPEPQQ